MTNEYEFKVSGLVIINAENFEEAEELSWKIVDDTNFLIKTDLDAVVSDLSVFSGVKLTAESKSIYHNKYNLVKGV